MTHYVIGRGMTLGRSPLWDMWVADMFVWGPHMMKDGLRRVRSPIAPLSTPSKENDHVVSVLNRGTGTVAECGVQPCGLACAIDPLRQEWLTGLNRGLWEWVFKPRV